jgi:hypothetical protein
MAAKHERISLLGGAPRQSDPATMIDSNVFNFPRSSRFGIEGSGTN